MQMYVNFYFSGRNFSKRLKFATCKNHEVLVIPSFYI